MKSFTKIITGAESAQQIARKLVISSIGHEVTPLAEDKWKISVKEEHRDKLDLYAEEVRKSAQGPIKRALESLDVARECGGELDIPDYEESYQILKTMRDAILKHDRQINAAERAPTGDDYNDIMAILGLVADSRNESPVTGKIWWSADNMAEAKQWKVELLAKGAASVVLKPEHDREIVHVIITLDRSRAEEILGCSVDESDWLDESVDAKTQAEV